MRPSVYPVKLIVHETPDYAARLKAKAEREGATVAEIMRRALRREVQEAA